MVVSLGLERQITQSVPLTSSRLAVSDDTDAGDRSVDPVDRSMPKISCNSYPLSPYRSRCFRTVGLPVSLLTDKYVSWLASDSTDGTVSIMIGKSFVPSS